MNVYVSDEIKQKYPQMEFRGKIKIINNKKVIKAVNHSTNMRFYYSFDEDFFWFKDCEIPEVFLLKQNYPMWNIN